jgi:hypothetical protein
VVLTRRHRNDLFEMLATKGIDPADCELTDLGEEEREALLKKVALGPIPPKDGGHLYHLLSKSEFYFRSPPWGEDYPDRRFEGSDAYAVRWFVEHGPLIRIPCEHWADVLVQFGQWADEVRYIADTPDLWEELKRAPEILAATQAADASNAPFTADEQEEIGRRLDETKQLVRQQLELTGDQLAAVDQKLDELKEASKRLGRKDWATILIGGLVSTGMTDAVPPSVIQTVLSTVLHGLAHLFGIGGLPPIIGP